MGIVELVFLSGTFGSIVWGVARFFTPPRRGEWRARVLAAGALAGFSNQLAATWQAPGDPVRDTAAIGLYGASLIIFWSAILACDRLPLTAIFERDVPTRLVRSGPYRFVRHPFYASYILFWLAGWAGTGTWSTAAAAAAMSAAYVVAARLEEAKFVASPLAGSYEQYRRSSGLLLPRLGSLSPHLRRLRDSS